jgi:aldehyde dehydrogenase (NAD+)
VPGPLVSIRPAGEFGTLDPAPAEMDAGGDRWLTIEPYWQNYIDGAWVDGGAGRIDVTDPATGERLAEQALADAADVDRAVQAARACTVRRADRDAAGRARPHGAGHGRLSARAQGRDRPLLTLEQGKPLWEARIEIEGAARYFEYYGNQAEHGRRPLDPAGAGYFDFTEYEPRGVSAQIIPWNYPLEMTARSLSAALATGNACVIKTPELTR